MKWIDNWIRNKIRSALLGWLVENEGRISHMNHEIGRLKAEVSSLEVDIKEISTYKLKVPVEEYIFNSNSFQNSLREATKCAMQAWAPITDIQPTLSNLNGTVTSNEPFECYINEDIMIVMAGLKTTYIPEGSRQALYQMQVSNRITRPFFVDKETKQVVFLRHYLLKEETLFSIRQTEGSGILHFSLIGATLSRYNDPHRAEFELRPTKTCFICGRTIHCKEAIDNAKLLEKYTGQTARVMCCFCFKVAKTIIDGKREGGG